MTAPLQFGPFKVLERLGEGGMGAVYLCQHELVGHRVAIKVLLPALAHDEDAVRRLIVEARAASRVQHPGVVRIFDLARHDGGAYLVMELVQGQSLAALAAGRTLPAQRVARLGQHLAEALAAAHACGVVHRDLKPDNIQVVLDAAVAGGERVKILDFGIARLTDVPAGPRCTRTGSIIGTPSYMAPEQCRGTGPVDSRADLYALGCILYELACGRPPFVSAGAGELLGAHQFKAPPRPAQLGHALPAALESLILALLAKRPGERPDAALLARELGRLAGPDALEPAPARVLTAPQLAPAIRRGTTLGRAAVQLEARPLTQVAPRRWSRLAVLALVAATLAALGGAYGLGRVGQPRTAAGDAAAAAAGAPPGCQDAPTPASTQRQDWRRAGTAAVPRR